MRVAWPEWPHPVLPTRRWAPTGSRFPEECPASGFVCPGAAADDVTGGSKPILVDSGQASVDVEVETVVFELQVDISPVEYEEEVVIAQLAAFYGIAPSLISVEAMPAAADHRRQLSHNGTAFFMTGGIILTVTIAVPVESPPPPPPLEAPQDGDQVADAGEDALTVGGSQGGAGSSGGALRSPPPPAPPHAPIVSGAAQLAARLAVVDDGALSAALGAPAVQATGPAVETATVQVAVECPKGYWCSAANRIPCGPNTYNNRTDQIDAGACTLCPPNSFSALASTALSDCRCLEGYYDAAVAHDAVDCVLCPIGSDCSGTGHTLPLLPLLRGYYRISDRSVDLRRCADFSSGGNRSACLGGEHGACRPWTAGPYCALCNVSDNSRYYDASECKPCEQGATTEVALQLVGVVAAVCLVLCAAAACIRNLRRAKRLVSQAELLYERLSLRGKIKQLSWLKWQMWTFYQITTKIETVYVISMPEQVERLLSRLSPVFSLGIDDFGLPLQCLSLASFYNKLLFTMIAPLVVITAVLLLCVAREILRALSADEATADLATLRQRRGSMARRSLRLLRVGGSAAAHGSGVAADGSDNGSSWWSEPLKDGVLRGLPVVLAISFLVFPMISSLAFRAFDCDTFEDGQSFLKADYEVDCHDGAEYDPIWWLAWVAVAIYPIGVPTIYAVLLYKARDPIRRDQPTTLSKALAFLHRDFEPRLFWWELVEVAKKLVLVGFMAVVQKGTLDQLLIALIFSLIHMLLMATAMPYRGQDDDYFATACNFGLTCVLFFCIALKVGVLTDAVDPVLSDALRDVFSISYTGLSIALFLLISSALVLMSAMAAQQIVAAARVPIIRLRKTHAAPELTLEGGQTWHLFLSHIWGTGQDQCATIKRQLTALLPGVAIFLDVDDLKDIGALETYVEQTATIMIFVSKGYFKSGNCLREARCTKEKDKPITLVHDPVRGGASLEFCRDEECPEELRGRPAG